MDMYSVLGGPQPLVPSAEVRPPLFFPRYLASGSGDTTVRFWDLSTETPHFTCQGQYACSYPPGRVLIEWQAGVDRVAGG